MSRRRIEEEIFERIASRVVEFLSDRGISPMSLTISAFAATIISSILYLYASSNRLLYLPAAITLALSGFLDAVDGAVARRMDGTSRLGAFLDSVFDKLGECLILVAIICSGAVDVLWGSIALASSILVSYVRHRAEPLGVSLKGVGIGERAERMIILIIASLITPFIEDALNYGIVLIAVLASITVAWRIIYAASRLRA
ncbi:MAG: CDP-alcohol phosphatidyltransferase family protein [Thaumarchaeota archaeon]|nr:CDP-alcohol phosphatidyltransferase family protein [Nitrososphaerota archaeon]